MSIGDRMKINKMDNLFDYFKNFLIGIAVISIYLLLPSFEVPLLEFFNINVNNIPVFVEHIYLFFFEILMLSSILLVFHKDIEMNFKDLKKNHRKYFDKYFKYWILAFGIMIVCNFILGIFSDYKISGNEKAIREIFSTSPIYVYILSVFIAPLLEELVFRKAIRNIIPSKILFIIFSGVIFGGAHIIGNCSNLIDFLYIIPYGIYGSAFAYMFVKTDNIFVSSGFHLMHNGLLLSLQFFILIFS